MVSRGWQTQASAIPAIPPARRWVPRGTLGFFSLEEGFEDEVEADVEGDMVERLADELGVVAVSFLAVSDRSGR